MEWWERMLWEGLGKVTRKGGWATSENATQAL